ncbi:MAG: right-handed parallel beta-helix repeat-containing protein [Acetatifactor sp.]|nr:right-handed parallel beta-helix repeat-containing protein [Acetatifactor sp.]
MKKQSIFKKLALFASVALLSFSLAACGGEGAKTSADDDEERTESSVEKTSAEPSTDGEGEIQTKPVKTSKELYEGFLKGEEKVYCDNVNITYYDWDNDKDIPYFDNKDGYTLRDFVRRIQDVEDRDTDIATRVVSASWMDLDCGNDGEPELGLQVVTEGDLWGEGGSSDYVIKNIDGKLQICHRTESGYRSYNSIVNQYGFIDDSYYWGMGWSASYGIINAEGKYQYVYGVMSDSAYDWYGTDEPLGKAFSELVEEDDEFLFDYFEILQYRFEPWQENEDESKVLTYSYETYCDGDSLTEDAIKELLEKVFAQANIKLYTEAEVQTMIDAHVEKLGISRTMTLPAYTGVDWKSIDQRDFWPGDVITVKNTDELINAFKSGNLIYLEPGTYNLTKWLRDENGFSKMPKYLYEDEGGTNSEGLLYTGWDEDNWEVMAYHLRNVVLNSADPENPARIVCECPGSRVLAFEDCDFIDINNVVFGHEIEPGVCSGDVLAFRLGNYVTLTGCDLYGCGAHAIELWECSDVTLDSCVIHDCTYGCMVMYDNGYTYVKNTRFENCKEYTMFTLTSGSVYFDGCSFRNLQGDMFYVGEDAYVTFSDCQFDKNALESLQRNTAYDKKIFIY